MTTREASETPAASSTRSISAGAGSSEPTRVSPSIGEVGVAQEARAGDVAFLERRGTIGDVQHDQIGVLQVRRQVGDADQHRRVRLGRCLGRRRQAGQRDREREREEGANHVGPPVEYRQGNVAAV